MTERDALARWLDPQLRAFIARSDAFDTDTAGEGGIAHSRARYDALCAAFAAPHPAGVRVSRSQIGPVPVRRYDPPAPPCPATLLYLHGGGFSLGGLDSHDSICAELCAFACVTVVVADYRLAPEHVYPAALDDADSVYRALAAGRPVVLAGDSAGAHLAAALCLRLRRRGVAQPAGQVLIYPSLGGDLRRVRESRAAHAPMLNAAACEQFRDLYAGGAAQVPADDPEFAPLAAADLSGLAPAAIFAAGYDPLRQDAEDYAALLHAAGVAVTYRCDPGLVHGWLRARHCSDLAAEAFADVVRAVARLAGGR